MKEKVKILLSVIVFGSFLSVEGATTSIWQETDYSHFYRGEWQNISLTGKGELILGATTELVYDFQESHIWSLIVDETRGLIYAGTGNEGRIFKIDGEEGSLLYDSEEIAIYSLSLNKEGYLFAGGSPGGIIYKIKPQNSQATIFADLEEEYIWALAFDSQGYLYAGTGRPGRIYRLSPQGEVKLLFDSPESHILSLIVDEDDNLYATSKGEGIIYRIDRKGEVLALFDPPQKEVRLLVRDSKGNLFAGAIGEKIGEKEKPAEITSFVYKITPEGDYQEWFRLDGILLSLFIDEKDNLYLGTGNNGRLYKINPQGEVRILLEVVSPQILSLAQGKKDHLYLGSANPGRLYTFSSVYYAPEGTFISQVHDTLFISCWGRISYRGETPKGTTIALSTRSGNTSRPDDTWSKWSKKHYTREERITSPPARLIQYQVHLSTSDRSLTPIISEVSLAFQPRNQAPRITALRVVTPSDKEAGKREKITIAWEATDPNGDTLIYDLYFREERARSWKKLASEMSGTAYIRESIDLPDGICFIKLRVSDSTDNPFPYALTDEKISLPFLVDNTQPKVENLEVTFSGKVVTIRGNAKDNFSPIMRIDYSLNAGRWLPIRPLDGVFDSLSEPFEFTLPELPIGEYTLILKITDKNRNVGSANTIFLLEE